MLMTFLKLTLLLIQPLAVILQTGGLLFGDTSTRSSPASSAILKAVFFSTIPT
jgi:hypothetical protein